MRKTKKITKVRIQKQRSQKRLFAGVMVSLLIAATAYQVVNQRISASSNAASIRMVTYNVLISTTSKQTISDIKRIVSLKDPDVISLQELYQHGKRNEVLKAIACNDGCAYEAYAPNGGGAKEELVILWKRSHYSLDTSGSIKTADGWNELGRHHGALYFNFVKLNDITSPERQIIVGTNHLPSLVDRDDDGRPNWKKMPKRVAAYKQHMQKVNEKISFWNTNCQNAAIFITGDYNVNYRKDSKVKVSFFPYASFAKVDGHSNWQTTPFATNHPKATTLVPSPPIPGQPKNRLIDYVFLVKNGAAIDITGSSIISKQMHSDHNAVVASYKYQ